MKTRICFTVDTEFSINGAFAPPHTRRPLGEPLVWCAVGGTSQGLGFLLHCFETYGVRATFFVEALHPAYFPYQAMQPAIDAIAAAGHEVQLHLHPAWTVFAHEDWRERVVRQPRQDDLAGRSHDDLLGIIEAGCANFARWGLPRPRALRTGSLQHDWAVYEATSAAGIPFASNIGLAIYRSADPRLALFSGAHEIEGVLELPVLSYVDFRLGARQHLKTLTIQGCGSHETECLLWRAHEAQLPMVVILTHPFEYIHMHEGRHDDARKNTLTQRRLQRLCEFIARHDDCFESAGLVGAAEAFPRPARGRNLLLAAPAWTGLQRLVENRLAHYSPEAAASRRAVAGARR
jgi:peptidoglycan/xylan/chitin deacetylase (PgdA/CDA1 family)